MSTTSSQDPSWDDPRLTVFIIWGVFIFVVFFCIPSKRLVQRLCHKMAVRCCGYEEEINDAHNGGSGRAVLWDLLSPARKLEIDSLRASHLSYRLHPFSLTLEKKHMLIESAEAAAETPPPPTSTSKFDDNTEMPLEDGVSDNIEKGSSSDHGNLLSLVRRMSNAKLNSIRIHEDSGSTLGYGTTCSSSSNNNGCEEELKLEVEEENVPYTHILIPPPGHNYDGIDIMTMSPCTDKDESELVPTTNPKGGNYFRMRLFGGKTRVVVNDAVAASKGVDVVDGGENTSPKIILPNEEGKSKSCPNVCTICLMEYEISERVSWSSNKDCTHVFHEDCVIQWLVSLGRTKSKMLRFSEDPTEAQLLNYELECPCCRQEFIVSNERERGRRRVGDDNV